MPGKERSESPEGRVAAQAVISEHGLSKRMKFRVSGERPRSK